MSVEIQLKGATWRRGARYIDHGVSNIRDLGDERVGGAQGNICSGKIDVWPNDPRSAVKFGQAIDIQRGGLDRNSGKCCR